MIDDYGHNPSL